MIKNLFLSYGIGIVSYLLARGLDRPFNPLYDIGILVICTVLFFFYQWMDKVILQ